MALPHASRASRDAMKRFAVNAEDLGYDSLQTSEHVVVPMTVNSRYPYSADGKGYWDHEEDWTDAMVTLAFLAGVTERIRLCTSVIPAITRDPLSLAKQAASVDIVSGGRHELGLGAGWCFEEAELLGHPTDHPLGRLEETIEILRKAWSMSSFEHRGRFWSYDPVAVHPHPIQGAALPILLGGGAGRRLLGMTARLADGAILPPGRLESLGEISAALPRPRTVSVSVPVARDAPIAEIRELVLRLAGLGADRVVVWVARHDMDAALATIERFAREVIPTLD